MEKTPPNSDNLLLISNGWQPRKKSRSSLEACADTIFHLRFNRTCSLRAIKCFLEENGIKTSTAALSKFLRKKIKNEKIRERQEEVLARINELLKKSDNRSSTQAKEGAKDNECKQQGKEEIPAGQSQ